jgi:hypothetical protein
MQFVEYVAPLRETRNSFNILVYKLQAAQILNGRLVIQNGHHLEDNGIDLDLDLDMGILLK